LGLQQSRQPGDVKPVSKGVSELRIDYGPGIERISNSRGVSWLFYWLETTRRHKPRTSRPHFDSLTICRSKSNEKNTTSRYDVAEHLRTPEEMASYLEACLEEANGDAVFIAKALGDIARAKGMSQVARDTGLSRENLYKALTGERTPGFDTILKVVSGLGLKLHAEADRVP
jgi:probable addiction module antidote protein